MLTISRDHDISFMWCGFAFGGSVSVHGVAHEVQGRLAAIGVDIIVLLEVAHGESDLKWFVLLRDVGGGRIQDVCGQQGICV